MHTTCHCLVGILEALLDYSSSKIPTGQAITVNSARYCDVMIQFFLSKLQDTDDTWFQQDGATCHTTRETIQSLHESFPDRVISRFGGQIAFFFEVFPRFMPTRKSTAVSTKFNHVYAKRSMENFNKRWRMWR